MDITMMKQIPILINQLFELNEKLLTEDVYDKVGRNLKRLFNTIEEGGYLCKNPLGETYNESRTDCEANIAGRLSSNMVITKVIKPIIYKKNENEIILLQKAVVIVEAK